MRTIRLLSVELHKFKLLNLSSIQTITINFKERFHWFIGKNGVGKSVIVRECSPVSPDMSFFHDGGYKKTVWLVEGLTYVLTSTRIDKKKNTHSFVRYNEDGSYEELNYGHTATVYRSLTDSIFGMDKESRAISTGDLNLTDMDASARKSIFTALSATDYTYALGYYKRLYKSYRDILGSLNVDRERLVDLKSSQLRDDSESVFIEEIKNLKVQVEFLSNIRPNVSEPEHVVKQTIQSLQREIQTLFTKSQDYSKRHKHLYPLEEESVLVKNSISLSTTFDSLEARIDTLYRSFVDSTKLREEAIRNRGMTMSNLDERITELRTLISDFKYRFLSSNVSYEKALEDIDSAQRDFEAVQSTLTVMDPEEAADYDGAVVRYNTDLRLSNEAAVLLEKIQMDINSLESHSHSPDIQCPRCEFQFNPLFSQEKLASLKSRLMNVTERKISLDERRDESSAMVRKILAFQRGQSTWNDYIRRYPSLNDLWSKIMEEKLHCFDSSLIDQQFGLFRVDLTQKGQELILVRELEELNKKVEWNKHVDIEKDKDIEETIKKQEQELQKLYVEREDVLDRLGVAKSKLSLFNYLKTTAETALAMKTKLEEWLTKEYDHFERGYASDYIRMLDVEITKRETSLRTVSLKNSEIIRLEGMIAQSELKVKALKDAMKVLSPSEGLIAKGLTGFINHFTSLMNDIMSRIMTYKMVIPPLVVNDEDFELDYSIPIQTTGDNGTVSDSADVKLTSKGQREIINLAFRILYLKFRHLDASLLPLDEFGANLDHTHKQKAFDAIRQILNTSNFTQVLMVSHIENTYNLMDGAGVTVICPSNVNIPDNLSYNNTTEIVRC